MNQFSMDDLIEMHIYNDFLILFKNTAFSLFFSVMICRFLTHLSEEEPIKRIRNQVNTICMSICSKQFQSQYELGKYIITEGACRQLKVNKPKNIKL